MLHDQKVGAKRQVRSMLLGRANRQDQERAGSAAASFASDLVQEEPGSIAGFARVTMRHVPLHRIGVQIPSDARNSRLRRALSLGVPIPGRMSCSTTAQPS